MNSYPMQITANGKTIGIDNTKAFGETVAVPFDAIAQIVEDSTEYEFGNYRIEGTGEAVSWRVLD